MLILGMVYYGKTPTFSARHPNSMRAALLLLATTVVANVRFSWVMALGWRHHWQPALAT